MRKQESLSCENKSRRHNKVQEEEGDEKYKGIYNIVYIISPKPFQNLKILKAQSIPPQFWATGLNYADFYFIFINK